MPKIQSPLLGYNNNVRHKNRVFHIQTEDSGVKHPHVITHLFMDGGRILKSVKTSYAEHVGSDKLQDIVKQMMKDQHKAMFIALRDGTYDHLVDASAPKPRAAAAAPAPSAPAPSPTAPEVASPVATRPASVAPAPRPPSVRPPRPSTPPTPIATQAPPSSGPRTGLHSATIPAPKPSFSEPPGPRDMPSGYNRSDLPPPPATLFNKRPDSGRYAAVTTPREERSAPLSTRAGASGSRPPPPLPRRDTRPPSPDLTPPQHEHTPMHESQRYAPARPAAIFGQARPQQGSSIFGEDLISDKSLDEVILSYLAEDLEEK